MTPGFFWKSQLMLPAIFSPYTTEIKSLLFLFNLCNAPINVKWLYLGTGEPIVLTL